METMSKAVYESPKTVVLEVKCQQIICISGDASITGDRNDYGGAIPLSFSDMTELTDPLSMLP